MLPERNSSVKEQSISTYNQAQFENYLHFYALFAVCILVVFFTNPQSCPLHLSSRFAGITAKQSRIFNLIYINVVFFTHPIFTNKQNSMKNTNKSPEKANKRFKESILCKITFNNLIFPKTDKRTAKNKLTQQKQLNLTKKRINLFKYPIFAHLQRYIINFTVLYTVHCSNNQPFKNATITL